MRTAAACASPPTIPVLDVVRVRPFDVATFVAFGAAQLGILRRRRADGVRLSGNLRAARSRHRRLPDLGRRTRATPPAATTRARWSRVRVATKYPTIARRHYAARGVQAEVVHLNGAMELAPGLGLARADRRSGADRFHAGGQRAGGDRGDRADHPPADRQPHRAEDAARGDRRLDRAVPRRARGSMRRLRTDDAAFAPAFAALLAGARHRRPTCATPSPRSSPTCARAATRR